MLISGESGVGKELVAEALHYNAPGTVKPLIKVNCSALAENLLEKRIVRACQKARLPARSAIKSADFRWLMAAQFFLDEIGELSPAIQVKLLRFLQEKTIEKVGDNRSIQLNLRVIAATNCNLAEKVRRGTFREDLYYRLKVVEIDLPPLRERREDVPLLVAHFCERLNQTFKKQISGVSGEAMALFLDYDWPGNVRELEHALEHAFVLCRGDLIECEHLPREIRECDEFAPAPENLADETGSPDEAEHIRRALAKTDWNKAKAARLLGMDRRTIYRKIEKYHLTPSPEQ